jgi:hypothetical protein
MLSWAKCKRYSRKEKNNNYEYTHYVAQVKVDKLEKGEGISGLVYAPISTSSGSERRHAAAQAVTILARKLVKPIASIWHENAYDGMNDENKDGGYNVIYGNGFQPVKEP